MNKMGIDDIFGVLIAATLLVGFMILRFAFPVIVIVGTLRLLGVL